MPKYTEEHAENAIRDVENGGSMRTAAKRWGIPRTTLQSRTKGAEAAAIAQEPRKRLLRLQEGHLRDWILTQAALGLPPTHFQLLTFASRILVAGGDLQPLGKHWIEGFLRRNPEIKTLRGKRIDCARINGASTERTKEFFKILQLPASNTFPPNTDTIWTRRA